MNYSENKINRKQAHQMPPLSLPIFSESYRPSSNWSQDVARQKALRDELAPFTAETAAQIDAHLIASTVKENLRLGDIDIDDARVAALLAGDTPQNDNERAARGFADAVRHLHTLVKNSDDKTHVQLSADLLRELHTLALSNLNEPGGSFRSNAGQSLAPGHTPPEADLLPFLLDNALSWFSAESVQELHPIEQAWLVHLRLIELQPFARANGRIARLAASLYGLRADLGAIIVSAADRELYNHALTNSFQMITQPGVELFARSVVRTMSEVIAIASAKS
jgi:Fic family protein